MLSTCAMARRFNPPLDRTTKRSRTGRRVKRFALRHARRKVERTLRQISFVLTGSDNSVSSRNITARGFSPGRARATTVLVVPKSMPIDSCIFSFEKARFPQIVAASAGSRSVSRNARRPTPGRYSTRRPSLEGRVALLCGVSTPSLLALGGQRLPHIFNINRDIPCSGVGFTGTGVGLSGPVCSGKGLPAPSNACPSG